MPLSQKLEITVAKVLNMDIIFAQTHQFTSEGLYSPSGAVWSTFDGWRHFFILHQNLDPHLLPL